MTQQEHSDKPAHTQLQHYEIIIERGLETFLDVGQALLAIRDKRLYKQQHDTFEDYCRERWGMSRWKADKLIAAHGVVDNLSAIAPKTLPTNEAQARPLTQLEPEQQRAAWQQVVEAVPDGNITAKHVAEAVKAIKRVEKSKQREEERQDAIEQGEQSPATSGKWSVFLANAIDFLAGMEPSSVDFIITDPPYPKEYLPLYSQLAAQANYVLKPGGSLIVMCGQSYLPDIMQMFAAHLTYQWILTYLTPGGQSAQLWDRQVNTFWKPVLWFVKDSYAGNWIGDVVKSAVNDNDKRLHEWGQSISGMHDLVSRFVKPDDLVVDPFCGAGTTGVVTLDCGAQFIGVDNSEEQVLIARGRLNAR